MAPEEKKFLYEVGLVNKAFKSGLAKNVLGASRNIESAVAMMMRGLRDHANERGAGGRRTDRDGGN